MVGAHHSGIQVPLKGYIGFRVWGLGFRLQCLGLYGDYIRFEGEWKGR